ncbi:FkbM family methyltransferase (plasmid) [Thalassobaculum sp. OXR-137]|uniref:FkbM family methyltransferase n=1 Tax=Thalassobaculum sp. OXR-137 TaxID=3100173 RepID=UPI002AC9B1E4|nr:FkbM family methyltransferase [Thalassobaculum sp. OXR-137]WPZ37241.1 FkbM family methyltransferase [Thalassobaculum sp. OXR-137]
MIREPLRKARKLCRLLGDPALRRGLRYGVGAAIELAPLLDGIQVASIVDVGANKGQFALLATARFPEAPVVAFEPHSEAAAVFRRLFASQRQVVLHEAAVSDREGRAELQLSGRADCSSLLPIGDRMTAAVPGSGSVGTAAVTALCLDGLAELRDLPRPILLKLDIQGGELAALRGGRSLLDTVSYVLVEASFVAFYDGQPLIGDLVRWLHDAGFEPVAACSPWTDGDGRCVQIDLLFCAEDRTGTAGEPPSTIAR